MADLDLFVWQQGDDNDDTADDDPLPPREVEPLPPTRTRTAPPLSELTYEPPGQQISRGSFAAVRAARTADGQRFAVKVIGKASTSKVADKVKMMLDLSPRLDHIHLMASEAGVEQDSRCLYQVIELCEHGDLYTALQGAKKFSEEATRNAVAQIVSGVAHLHRFGITHRNLKPDTVLVASGGVLKLGSFIFAKVITDRSYTSVCHQRFWRSRGTTARWTSGPLGYSRTSSFTAR